MRRIIQLMRITRTAKVRLTPAYIMLLRQAADSICSASALMRSADMAKIFIRTPVSSPLSSSQRLTWAGEAAVPEFFKASSRNACNSRPLAPSNAS